MTIFLTIAYGFNRRSVPHATAEETVEGGQPASPDENSRLSIPFLLSYSSPGPPRVLRLLDTTRISYP